MKTFKEGYEIKFSYLKEDGFFEYGKKTIIYVNVVHGINEKNNHEIARKQFLNLKPKARIVSVSYI